ncbi:hypothetical protein AAU61_17825 [Desulfocarbo indianensis]|nr:hypothetical protein AAU61_17825 [Desulfocarbo indianensis]
MNRRDHDKPLGPRLPMAKGADKLMQEGVLAMQRGRWPRAEQRFSAALAQLRQVDPISERTYQAGQLLMRLRLAQADLRSAADLCREQLVLAEQLHGPQALETGWTLCDLAFILAALGNGQELESALKRLQALVARALREKPLLGFFLVQRLATHLEQMGRGGENAELYEWALRLAEISPHAEQDDLRQAFSRLAWYQAPQGEPPPEEGG